MSLYIEVYVGSRANRKLVAECHAYNISDLASVSDYEFTSLERGAPHLNIPASEVRGDVKRHDRRTSVWKLVEKIARAS
jgi:DNA-dependent RNA polymerase auxiliary subunit epsilon